jgi:hypothetical protein
MESQSRLIQLLYEKISGFGSCHMGVHRLTAWWTLKLVYSTDTFWLSPLQPGKGWDEVSVGASGGKTTPG